MNNFKKAALASALVLAASASFNASALDVASEANNTIIGCAVPPNGSAGATVYSIDSYDSNAAANTGMPSWLKQGASCSRAVNWFIAQSNSTYLTSVTNQVASNGYTLQSFLFTSNDSYSGATNVDAESTAIANGPVTMVGCAAPAGGTAGAVVYSVDGFNSANTTANAGVTYSAVGGNPCSAALMQTGAGQIDAVVNMRTADGAYSLMQYIVQ